MKESVLIINNDYETEKYLDILLVKSGYVTYKAEHGLKALRILNSNNISVIIYDLISEDTAEFGFLEYIKNKHSSIQVIVISKHILFELVLNAMKSGAYDFISKPLSEEKLLYSIEKAIHLKKELSHKSNSEKRNREYQKILVKELEATKNELDELKKDLETKNLELSLIYGHKYTDTTSKNSKQKSRTNIDLKKVRIGKYTILEEIGRGGMSIVYKAIDHILNREVAIKELTIIRKQLPREILEDLVKRFRKEAQVIAMLRNDNIVKVFDIIQEQENYYMIMEYVDGKTLDKIITGHRKLPVLEAVNIASEVCCALDYIHNNNIIHRDIKPSNIIIGNDRSVKLTDFGVIRDMSQSTITPTGSIIGTISYTAPEQSSKKIDYRVDLFSLGVILYEIVTGVNPFTGNTYADTFLKISSLRPDPPSIINQECNEMLDRIIMKSIEKDPDKRYLTAKEFYDDLINFTNTYQTSIA